MNVSRVSSIASVSLLLLGFGCDGGSVRDIPATPIEPVAAAPAVENDSRIDRTPAARFGSDEAGARALLSAFLDPGTDRAALTLALRPEPEDYAAVFAVDIAGQMRSAYEEAWRVESAKGNIVIAPKAGQTELLLNSATGADFNGGAAAADGFPSGYREMQGKLRDGVVIYRWKFVKPGEKIGMAYDGLAHVNGRWVWFPKPLRHLKSSA